MSTPDQPSPPLTRRQLRELRNTASTPIITQEEADEAAAAAATAETQTDDVAVEEAPESTSSVAVDTESEPAVDEVVASDADGDARPISRKQARAQAKLRTAAIELVPHDESDRDQDDVAAVEAEPVVEPEAEVDDESQPEPVADVEPEAEAADDAADDDAADEDPAVAEEPKTDDEAESTEKAPVVAPGLGAQLLSGEPGDVELPASFDHLLARGGGGGSSSAPNALILSQTPETGSLSVPIIGTGELLITGSYSLPQNYGSTGAVPGSQDGKDLDAALIDGELPPASSPTPIAASSAISTIKSADEIIRPPAPEKGSRLMMTLAITAGALALALATVLILAVVNGVF
ncbi:hypothetical protein BKA24_002181 [Microbacterium marinum]|uniref:Uncharacterized protein n=1 Tax=Microbacterium marinum TaxID=421115 RepID=A0A7W7BRF8_9MICO|nr:hypothetical protein [Microbacterium marinum]MBB4667472.1 hypothetical protein [Microbacterium marinum]